MLSIQKNANLLDNQSAFNDLLEKLYKRRLNTSIDIFTSRVRKALKQGGISPKIFEATIFLFLEEGRESRNYIAHDLAAGISRNINQDSFQKGLLETTRECIKKIVKADFYISVFMENYNNTQVHFSLESYIKKICDWVCNVEV